jgi:hypothetical protein
MNYYNIKEYNKDMYRLIYCKMPIKNSGFEDDRKIEYKRDVNKEKLSNNIARARSKIFEYAICNNFEYFVTLTVNGQHLDRYNLVEYIKKLGQFIRDYRKKYKANVQYLLIPEKHTDGAWHMHGLLKGILKEHLTINKYGYKDWNAYSKRFGYISIDDIKNKIAVSKYITKYISKSINNGGGVTEKESKLYYCSRGLKKPIKIHEGTLKSYQLNNIYFDFENEYIKSITLNKKEYEKIKKVLDE